MKGFRAVLEAAVVVVVELQVLLLVLLLLVALLQLLVLAYSVVGVSDDFVVASAGALVAKRFASNSFLLLLGCCYRVNCRD